MIAARPFSAARAIAENLAVAFLMVVMWAVISLDANAEQEAFNRGGIYVVAATALVHVALSLWLAQHPLTARRTWFIRRGGMCLMLVGMVIYIVAMSVWTGRIL
jgi:hypothetical protein